jgi:hypothetical protein
VLKDKIIGEIIFGNKDKTEREKEAHPEFQGISFPALRETALKLTDCFPLLRVEKKKRQPVLCCLDMGAKDRPFQESEQVSKYER